MARIGPAALALVVAGCGDKLVGLDDRPTPLASVSVEVSGAPDVPLRVALVWGDQWLPEPFCFLPAESEGAAKVIAAGCPDSYGFAPRRVSTSSTVSAGRATLVLYDLPSADLMIGDTTARVAFASVVLFEDRNGNGELDLRRSAFGLGEPSDEPDAGPLDTGPRDVVHAASFVSMTQPDQRLAFREGAFDPSSGFYPRAGCGDPPRGLSVLGAGGFTEAAAITALLQGKLPEQDPATCREGSLDAAVVTLAARPSVEVQPVACVRRDRQGVPRYREPTAEAPELDERIWACAGLPSLDGTADPSIQQLVVAGLPENACKSVTHYTLRGCDRDPTCAIPEWDRTGNPPPWWPCQ